MKYIELTFFLLVLFISWRIYKSPRVDAWIDRVFGGEQDATSIADDKNIAEQQARAYREKLQKEQDEIEKERERLSQMDPTPKTKKPRKPRTPRNKTTI